MIFTVQRKTTKHFSHFSLRPIFVHLLCIYKLMFIIVTEIWYGHRFGLGCGQDSSARANISYGVDISPASSLCLFKQNMNLLAFFVDNFKHCIYAFISPAYGAHKIVWLMVRT